jgi:replicative superfamily II helicase
LKEILMRRQFLTTLALAVSALASAPPTAAQIVPAEVLKSAPPEIVQTAPAYSDGELKSFAVAVLEVKRVTDVYLPKLQIAATLEERHQVEETASTEMKQAVENKGFTVTRFNEILSQAKIHPELAARIRQHIQEPEPQQEEQ